MHPTLILGIIGSGTLIVVLFELLRRRHLRGKFAVLWIGVALVSLVLTIFPSLLFLASEIIGVEVPSNLLFFAAILLLLVASIQHSFEVGRLEERTRTLAEELALLQFNSSDRDEGE